MLLKLVVELLVDHQDCLLLEWIARAEAADRSVANICHRLFFACRIQRLPNSDRKPTGRVGFAKAGWANLCDERCPAKIQHNGNNQPTGYSFHLKNNGSKGYAMPILT